MAVSLKGEVAMPVDPEHCEICDWPLVPHGEAGCWKGNCSYRPREGTDEYRRIEERRDALRRAAGGEDAK